MELEVLRVMQSTREDEALVAAVHGTVVEDGRDALAQVAALLQECMDASSWRDCRVQCRGSSAGLRRRVAGGGGAVPVGRAGVPVTGARHLGDRSWTETRRKR